MSTENFLAPTLGPSFTVWAFTPDNSREAQLRRYGDYLSKLLGGELRQGLPEVDGNGNGHLGSAEISRQLVVYGEPAPHVLRQLVAGRSYKRFLKQCQRSLLIVNQPKIPIDRILLVLRTEEIDRAAVEWLIRLAQPSEADVAILPVLPMIPVVHSLNFERQRDLGSLLSPISREGLLLRQFSRDLAEAHIEANLHLRQGEPIWQLKRELVAANYDLIIVGEDPVNMWSRLFHSELAALLLRCTRKPVLVARCARNPETPS